MSDLFYDRTTCSMCSSGDLELVLPLNPTPVGDKYVPYERREEVMDLLPLEIYLCISCGQLQTGVVANPEFIYRHYLSRPAAVNRKLSDDYQEYADDLMRRFRPDGGGFVVEIGSNDGIFSRNLQDRGMRALGVEPALNLAKQATEAGLESLPEFFSSELAAKIRQKHGPASLVIANHSYSNIAEIADAAEGIRSLLDEDGVFSLQTFYTVDVLEKKLLENFNHEHLSYFYVKSMRDFFARHGMEMIDAIRVPAKGGSIRCFMQLAGGPHEVSPAVAELVAYEEKIGMDRPETYKSVASFSETTRKQLHDVLEEAKAQNKKIAAYGTSIGATIFTYQYELGDFLGFYVDDDPYRQGLVSPGHHIPVVSSDALLEEKPDYVVILAPLYAENIMKKNQTHKDSGGKFILIWPEFAVV
jgi:hypothetical protein|tara:strand:+ start:613 stop:1857 length:1245 start_codon:yes stop_codon:yes gene_type:complete